jgi:hypothetical protein
MAPTTQPPPSPSQRPHNFHVEVKDNELVATLNGEEVAKGWIDDNVAVAVEENYQDNPLHYYVRIWIDGRHDIKYTDNAISEFRKVAEDVYFVVLQTARSLGDDRPSLPPIGPPPPINPPKRAKLSPPKKALPKIIVPPKEPADDPFAPFWESDPEPPQAYFTPQVRTLREHMARDDSDVEDLAIELSIPELRSLRFDERVRLIRWIADNYFVGDDKERTLNDLIDTTLEPDAARLIAELRAKNSELLFRLRDVIDGEEYVKFHEALRRLYLRSMTPEQTLRAAGQARATAMVWADPGLIEFVQSGRVGYDVTLNPDGTIHVRRRLSAPIPMGTMELAPLDLDPFQMIAVYFKFGEDLLGGSKGSVVYMPAVNLLLLTNKEFKQDLELAMNTGMVFGGGAGIIRATGRVALALAIAELTVGAANITIDNYKSELEKTPEGQTFLRSWEVVNLLFAAYSLGRTLRSAPQAIRELRDAYRAFQAVRGALDPAVVASVEGEMARVLQQADEVEKALAEEAHGDISEPPSRRPTVDIDAEEPDPGPLIEQVPAPPAKELARTIDERLAQSKVFQKWIAPRQAAGVTASKLGVSVLPEEEYVKYRSSRFENLEGKINPGTGKKYTAEELRAIEQRRLEIAKKSRGYVDPATGRATFPSNRYEPGNDIHEGLHQLQSNEFKKLGRAISEGTTEYFTLIIANEENIPRNFLKYQQERFVVGEIARVAGFENLADAYFSGDIAKIKSAFEAGKPGLWNEFLELCKNGKLSEARALVDRYFESVPPGGS